MIAIIDYGAGNLKNVQHAFKILGYESFITSRPSDLKKAKGLILPGVGAFGEAMKRLKEYGYVDAIKKEVANGKPLLGICLGMQLLFDISYEHGEHEGLGLIKGEIVRFETNLKVPHMGWNQVYLSKDDLINQNVKDGDYVYFVHSYYARPKNDQDILYTTDYGVTFPAAVKKGNIVGMQYHPEKSSKVGMEMLKNFGELVK